MNPGNGRCANDIFSETDIEDARARLVRFAPLVENLFEETSGNAGIIDSPIVAAPAMQKVLEERFSMPLSGRLLLKLDSQLPVCGSIKARGGIYEVLRFAENLLLRAGLLDLGDDYSKIACEEMKRHLVRYHIAVGSTGNLGLAVGIVAARLGFMASVHMSCDAQEWKKSILRRHGVSVIEHDGDYSNAVAAGRDESGKDPYRHFVDDEHSRDLFMGYSVAARHLAGQLQAMDVRIDRTHPLFVYVPCGVGGGPGGVTYGIKTIFGEHAHCFFGEPTHSPCMLLGLHTGKHENITVFDIGLDNITAADGLAVPRPSGLACRMMEGMLEGIYTVSDDELFRLLALMWEHERINLEPSALAGVPGVIHSNRLYGSRALKNATHIAWCTGGSMVPPSVMKEYILKGQSLL